MQDITIQQEHEENLPAHHSYRVSLLPLFGAAEGFNGVLVEFTVATAALDGGEHVSKATLAVEQKKGEDPGATMQRAISEMARLASETDSSLRRRADEMIKAHLN